MRQSGATVLHEALANQFQIALQLGSGLVRGGRSQPSARGLQADGHEQKKTPVPFRGGCSLKFGCRFGDGSLVGIETPFETGRSGNLANRNTQAANEHVDGREIMIERSLVRKSERLARAVGSSERIAITVAADPGAKSHTDRQARRLQF